MHTHTHTHTCTHTHTHTCTHTHAHTHTHNTHTHTTHTHTPTGSWSWVCVVCARACISILVSLYVCWIHRKCSPEEHINVLTNTQEDCTKSHSEKPAGKPKQRTWGMCTNKNKLLVSNYGHKLNTSMLNNPPSPIDCTHNHNLHFITLAITPSECCFHGNRVTQVSWHYGWAI